MSANYTTTADVMQFMRDMRKDELKNRNRDIAPNRYRGPLDNYEPGPREFAAGFAIKYSTDFVTNAIVLFHDDQFFERGKKPNLLFLVQRNSNALPVPYYVASWNVTGLFYILHPVGSGQQFGPRKTYSIALTEEMWV